jgi:hypothetical protein
MIMSRRRGTGARDHRAVSQTRVSVVIDTMISACARKIIVSGQAYGAPAARAPQTADGPATHEG